MDEYEYDSRWLQLAEFAASEGMTYYDPDSPTVWKRFVLGAVPLWQRVLWILFPPSLSVLMEMQRKQQDRLSTRTDR